MITITLPGSKSYTNRALLVASLATGTSILTHTLESDDTAYMNQALTSLGILIQRKKNYLEVYGTGGRLIPSPKKEIYVGNAGTTLRFLTSLLTLVPAAITLTGNTRMQERPIAPLVDALLQMHVAISYQKNIGFPPLTIQGNNFPGGTISLGGDISSQYISSLLLVAPYAQQDTTIILTSSLTSKPYIDITLDVMKSFGVTVKNNNYQQFFIPHQQRYQPREYTIEPDASSASYFLAAATLINTPLQVKNLGITSVQGDSKFIDILETFGCSVTRTKKSIGIKKGCLHVKSRIFDMNTMPDSVQTLAVLAALIPQKTTITNIATLRFKETDRIQALENELAKLGIQTSSTSNTLTITGKNIKDIKQNIAIETYNDHRMAMSFAVLQLVVPTLKIKNPNCVSKSYPDFWHDFGVFKNLPTNRKLFS